MQAAARLCSSGVKATDEDAMSVAEQHQQVLTYREFFPSGHDVLERILPDATNRMIFNFGDIAICKVPHQASAPVQVVGAWSRPSIITLHGTMDGISVSLRPGYLRAVLGVPAGEISGQVLHLDEL